MFHTTAVRLDNKLFGSRLDVTYASVAASTRKRCEPRAITTLVSTWVSLKISEARETATATYHGDPRVDEAESHERVAADCHQHGDHHPEDVASGEVDREADDGRGYQGDDVDDSSTGVGVSRRHLELANEEHPAE